MLTMNRLLEILENWSDWMQKPSTNLGFPSRSLVMSTGGSSTEESFNELISIQDKNNVLILDTLINNLPKEQKEAIYCRYLKSNKPFAYEYKLSLAIDNLLTLASKRILI